MTLLSRSSPPSRVDLKTAECRHVQSVVGGGGGATYDLPSTRSVLPWSPSRCPSHYRYLELARLACSPHNPHNSIASHRIRGSWQSRLPVLKPWDRGVRFATMSEPRLSS